VKSSQYFHKVITTTWWRIFSYHCYTWQELARKKGKYDKRWAQLYIFNQSTSSWRYATFDRVPL